MAREPVPTTTVGKDVPAWTVGKTRNDHAIVHDFLCGVRRHGFAKATGKLQAEPPYRLLCGGDLLVQIIDGAPWARMSAMIQYDRSIEVIDQVGAMLGLHDRCVTSRLNELNERKFTQFFYGGKPVREGEWFPICGPLTLLAYRAARPTPQVA